MRFDQPSAPYRPYKGGQYDQCHHVQVAKIHLYTRGGEKLFGEGPPGRITEDEDAIAQQKGEKSVEDKDVAEAGVAGAVNALTAPLTDLLDLARSLLDSVREAVEAADKLLEALEDRC